MMTDTERTLEALERNQQKRARFYLRRELGKETEYFEINGHIFDPEPTESDAATNKWCRDGGCEMSHPAHAETETCPASLEGHSWQMNDKHTLRKEEEWEERHDWGLEQ